MTLIQGGGNGTLAEQVAAGKVTPKGDPITTPAANFQGVDPSGKLVDITAPNASAAIATPGLDSHSGVITTPPGVNGTSVADQLAAAKTQALSIQAKLKAIDGTGSNGVTSSSGTSRDTENDLGTKITTASAPTYQGPTNNTSYLDTFSKMYSDLYNNDIDSINTSSDSDEAATAAAQNKETGTVSTQVARLGGYLGDSGSGLGVLTNLATSHRAEIASLESKRQAALQAARDGYAKQAFGLAQAKMEEADKYEQEAYDRQQTFFTQSQKIINQQAIAKAIKGGAKTTQEISDALGGNVSVDDINSYVKGVTPDNSGDFKFTTADTTKLLGSGLSQKDISGVIDYVNANGYDDKLRSTLTPSERTMLDSVFLPKAPATGTGVGGALSIAEAKSLGLPTSLIGRNQQQVISDLNSSTPPSWYQEYVTSGWADPNAAVNPEGLAKEWQAFRQSILSENVEGNPYAVNAPKKTTASGSSSGPSSDDLFGGT